MAVGASIEVIMRSPALNWPVGVQRQQITVGFSITRARAATGGLTSSRLGRTFRVNHGCPRRLPGRTHARRLTLAQRILPLRPPRNLHSAGQDPAAGPAGRARRGRVRIRRRRARIDDAIALEDDAAAADGHNHEHGAEVGRGTQKVGLFQATGLSGLVTGGLFALAFAALRRARRSCVTRR